jgi:hypothetical protein
MQDTYATFVYVGVGDVCPFSIPFVKLALISLKIAMPKGYNGVSRAGRFE